MAEARVEEAEKLMKKAGKFVSPSLFDFRLKPDWEAAAPLYERAAVLFKQSRLLERNIEALERASTAQERMQSPFHAAKHMEAAADAAKQLAQWDRFLAFTKAAGELYITSGKTTAAADALARGAKVLEGYDVEHAMALLYDAIDIYESETRESNAQDVFRQAINLAVKSKRLGEAVELLMRFATMSERLGATNSQCKCYLGAIVVHLYAKEMKQAWQLYQDSMLVDCFMSSDDAFAADALFNAFRSGDEAAVQAVVKSKHIFKQLENQVSRLAMKLPQGDMAKHARRLDRMMGPDEDYDAGDGHAHHGGHYEEGEEGEGEQEEELL